MSESETLQEKRSTPESSVPETEKATAQDGKAAVSAPEVSCEVCRDLMPLVADGVASDDSAAIVAVHTAGCKACCALLASGAATDASAPNDARILKRLSRKMALQSSVVALAGVLGGAVLMNRTGGVYLMWWLPLVGALAYFMLRRRWWLAPALVGALATVGMAAFAFFSGWFNLQTILIMPLVYGVSWAILAAVGAGVGALLCFAFGKEKNEDENEEQGERKQ
ncbi:MAG: zf-HC2 domain-containing protein [Ruthenibacterium sp.]